MRLVLLIVVAILALVLLGAAAWLYRPDRARASLEAAYAAPPSQFIEVEGVRLHIRDTGPRDAPAVLFVHGFAASLHTWEDWAAILVPEFRVVRFDVPGFGLTGPDPTGDYADARSHAVMAGLLDRLGIARAHVVGSSMGGRIAWTFAAAVPDRVAKLVLMAPDGFASGGRGYGAVPRLPWIARLLPYVLPDYLLRRSLGAAFADPTLMTDALLARYRDMLLAPGIRRAILDRIGQSVLVEPEPLLRRIGAPTLLLWGERDAMVPFRHAADYERLLPDATLAALPGIGHVPQEEAPAATIEPLRAFLRQ